jgi:hypothetical protein
MVILASILSPTAVTVIVLVGLLLFRRRIPFLTHSLGHALGHVGKVISRR